MTKRGFAPSRGGRSRPKARKVCTSGMSLTWMPNLSHASSRHCLWSPPGATMRMRLACLISAYAMPSSVLPRPGSLARIAPSCIAARHTSSIWNGLKVSLDMVRWIKETAASFPRSGGGWFGSEGGLSGEPAECVRRAAREQPHRQFHEQEPQRREAIDQGDDVHEGYFEGVLRFLLLHRISVAARASAPCRSGTW